jgi:hypothetical protein
MYMMTQRTGVVELLSCTEYVGQGAIQDVFFLGDTPT